MVDSATLVAIILCWVTPAILYAMLHKKPIATFELHEYQIKFLESLATSKLKAVEEYAQSSGTSGAAAALGSIVAQAMQSAAVHSAVYDTFHCVHCGSVQPAAWIKEHKGKKAPYELAVPKDVSKFLATSLLVPVEKLGEPPVRQVVPGARKADASKAARCAIDWAIKSYEAVETGVPKIAAKTTRASKSPKRGR